MGFFTTALAIAGTIIGIKVAKNAAEKKRKAKEEAQILCPYCGAKLNEQKGFDKNAEFYECTTCDKMWRNGDWHCERCNANLSKQDGFEGMDWDYFKCTECGEIFYNAEFNCPHCNAILNDQEGFNPELNFHKCTECGKTIYSDDDKMYSGEEFKDVYWYCDKCNALLSIQPGFTDTKHSWDCLKCGYTNIISAEHIRPDNIFCEVCKAELTGDSHFCSYCGSKVRVGRKNFCHSCGQKVNSDAVFCHNCGNKLD